MTVHLATKLEIKSFDEEAYRELPDGRKFTRTDIVLSVSEKDIEADVTWEALSCYAADGSGSYAGLMRVVGRLGDRTGEFVLRGTGAYDGTEATIEAEILPWSGVGELTGIHGTGRSVSTHDTYPLMPLTLDYSVG